MFEQNNNFKRKLLKIFNKQYQFYKKFNFYMSILSFLLNKFNKWKNVLTICKLILKSYFCLIKLMFYKKFLASFIINITKK